MNDGVSTHAVINSANDGVSTHAAIISVNEGVSTHAAIIRVNDGVSTHTANIRVRDGVSIIHNQLPSMGQEYHGGHLLYMRVVKKILLVHSSLSTL